MLQRYFIQLSYNGTNYHGWQVQPNATTVQETIEKGLSTILREKIAAVGAGRTDTGVHASFFVAHFDSQKDNLSHPDFTYKLNSFFPADIAVQKIWKVPADAHARFDAISRTYHYYITTQKDPFGIQASYKYLLPLDLEAMNEAAKTLLGYSDFTSFSRLHTDVKTNNCKIYAAQWEKKGQQLVFSIKADRFLRNMVRAVVGTLLDVGKRKLTVEDVKQIIEKKDRGVAGASAPAEGLFLTHIEYPDELMELKSQKR